MNIGASLRWFFPALLLACGAHAQTPIEECAQAAADRNALITCLDQKLRQANLRLNAALKTAQERVEKLEKENRRAGMSNFIDSQRKFNAYRDSNCTWQAVQAAPGSRGEDIVRDCQIRATELRERELLAFAQAESNAAAALPAEAAAASGPAPAAETAQAPVATEAEDNGVTAIVTPPQPPAASGRQNDGARRGVEWRLVSWLADGLERSLEPESGVTISFDPSGKLSGNASVNRFNGQYRFNPDGDLEWPRAGFALTRMSGPPELMKQERAFLTALRRTRHYRVEGEQLVLESADRSVILTFTR